MKKLITICVGLIVAGCATTTQLEEIEKRLARIEGYLYKAEEMSTQKAEKYEANNAAEATLALASEVDAKAVDARIDAFLKEYFGVQFGDSADKFPGDNYFGSPRPGVFPMSNIPVLKKFKYFDKAKGCFCDGKLFKVWFEADIDNKYSFDSTVEKMELIFADFAVALGFERTAFGQLESEYGSEPNMLSNSVIYKYKILNGFAYMLTLRIYNDKALGSQTGYRRCVMEFSNRVLKAQLENEVRRKVNASGETMPDAE